MRRLVFCGVFLLCNACITIEHRDGQRPSIECEDCKNFCTKDVDIELKSDKILFECVIKI